MRTLIQNSDLKRMFGGASIAVAAGLLMGAAMQPNLTPDEIEGPQQLMGASGSRTYDAPHDPGVAAYQGRVPDHVIGTDALRPPRQVVLAYQDRYEHADDDVMAYEAPEAAPARWQDEPREPTRYPSQYGNPHYETDLPPPPEAPSDADEGWDPV